MQSQTQIPNCTEFFQKIILYMKMMEVHEGSKFTPLLHSLHLLLEHLNRARGMLFDSQSFAIDQETRGS